MKKLFLIWFIVNAIVLLDFQLRLKNIFPYYGWSLIDIFNVYVCSIIAIAFIAPVIINLYKIHVMKQK